jgi:hypothetical protein
MAICLLRTSSATIVLPVPITIAPARVVLHAVIFDGVVARVRRLQNVWVAIERFCAAVIAVDTLVDRVSSVRHSAPYTDPLAGLPNA